MAAAVLRVALQAAAVQTHCDQAAMQLLLRVLVELVLLLVQRGGATHLHNAVSCQ